MDNSLRLDNHQALFVQDRLRAYELGKNYAPMFADMGTGKTPAFIALAGEIASRAEQKTGKPSTVWLVTEKSVKLQIVDEIKRWEKRPIASSMDVIMLDGTAEDRRAQLIVVEGLHPKWVVLNYSQLVLHATDLQRLVDHETDILILDEGDKIQNPESQRSQVARGIPFHYTMVATGTAIYNRVDTLYALLQVLEPGQTRRGVMCDINGERIPLALPYSTGSWGSRPAFLNEYATVNEYGRVTGCKNVPKLHRKLEEWGAWIVKRSDVLDLPESHTHTVKLDLEPGQRALYERIKLGTIEWIEQAASKEWSESRWDNTRRAHLKLRILAQLTYCSLCCSLPPGELVRHILHNQRKGSGPEGTVDVTGFEDDDSNAKTRWIQNYVASLPEKDGAVIFSQWTSVLDQIERTIKHQETMMGKPLAMRRIDGSTSMEERYTTQQRVAHGECKIVLTTTAGGRGLNLQALNHAVIIDPPWLPGDVQQVIGRIERRGQENEMHVSYLVTQDTIESKKKYPTLLNKQRDFNAIMYGNRGRTSDPLMDLEDVRDVIGWL